MNGATKVSTHRPMSVGRNQVFPLGPSERFGPGERAALPQPTLKGPRAHPAGLPSWTSRCGRRPRSFRIRQAAGAGAVTSASEMSKPSCRSSPTSLSRDFCDSLVQNLTFSRDCFSLEVGMTGRGCC